MYCVGQKVVYGIHGVCVILNIDTKTVGRQKVQYYVLEPIDQPGARYYIPVHNPVAVSKLCPVMTRQELDTLLSEPIDSEKIWIPDENQRKQRYRDLIGSGDRRALIAMIHALYAHKEQQAQLGRKFHLCDENFLRDAQKLLSSEFSLVLEMPQEETVSYIMNAIYS